MKRSRIVNDIAEVMHREYPDVKVYLYGSEARGEANEDSDIDLLVLVDKSEVKMQDRLEMRVPLYDIELSTGVIISPYFDTVDGWNSRSTEFSNNVNKERVLL